MNNLRKYELMGLLLHLLMYVSNKDNSLRLENDILNQQRIIKITEISRKKINNLMNELKNLEIIFVNSGDGDSRSNIYYISHEIYFKGKFYYENLLKKLSLNEGKVLEFANFKKESEMNEIENKIAENNKKVYFIREVESGNIKIGVSRNVEGRIKTLKTSTPYELEIIKYVNGDESKERELHEKFKDIKINREWFKGVDKLIKYIDSL